MNRRAKIIFSLVSILVILSFAIVFRSLQNPWTKGYNVFFGIIRSVFSENDFVLIDQYAALDDDYYIYLCNENYPDIFNSIEEQMVSHDLVSHKNPLTINNITYQYIVYETWDNLFVIYINISFLDRLKY